MSLISILRTVATIGLVLLASPGVTRAETRPSGLGAGGPTRITFGQHDLESILHVMVGQSQDEIHYGVRLDSFCRPAGSQPVFAYRRRVPAGRPWIGFSLTNDEHKTFGVAPFQRTDLRANGFSVSTLVKPISNRIVRIDVTRIEGRCHFRTETTMNGEDAVLHYMRMEIGTSSQFEVSLTGSSLDGQTPLQERWHPPRFYVPGARISNSYRPTRGGWTPKFQRPAVRVR